MQVPILLIGRVLFMLPFLVLGFGHFMNADAMSGMVPTWVPGGIFWVYLTGAFNIAAAIAIVSGFKARLAGILLGVLLITYALTIHLAGVMSATDEGMKMMAMSNMLKDLGLAGGAFIFSHLMATKS